MTFTDLHSPDAAATPSFTPSRVRRGPLARIVLASLLCGGIAAAILVLVAFPGAREHVTTGVALLGFAGGWAMLAALTTRRTSSPQRWAYLPASVLGGAGLGLLILAPGDQALARAAWVWPPVVLAVVLWSARRMRAALPGRSRWLLYPLLGTLALAGVGAYVENIAVQRDASALTMSGRLYDVGGYRLHLSCAGTGSPTVVLESGLGGSSPSWAPISAATRGTTRVCVYDRAGMGWSDSAPRPHDSVAVVADLHRLLAVAGERGPYVLVGHSTGGVYAMTYAARHPDQVAGLVLLDSASPRQFTVLSKYAGQYPMMQRLYGVAPVLTRLGVGRLVPGLSSSEVPGKAGKQAGILAVTPRTWRTARDELSTYARTFSQAQALRTLGSKPLVVVSASESLSDTPGWSTAQQQLAALSSNVDRRTLISSHQGVVDRPSSVPAVVAAIDDVVAAARTGAHVRTS